MKAPGFGGLGPVREFPNIRGTLFWGPSVLILRILLFRVITIFGSPIFGNSHISLRAWGWGCDDGALLMVMVMIVALKLEMN